MAKIPVKRAVFTSAKRHKLSGYHLVARSSGIDESLAQTLSRWSPSHGGMLEDQDHAASLNQYPVAEDQVVLSRSVYGGPEYSGRGGLQTVTLSLILSNKDLAITEWNSFPFFRLAMSNGDLRFNAFAYQCDELQYDRPLRAAKLPCVNEKWKPTLCEVSEMLLADEPRICVVGIPQRETAGFMESVLLRVPPQIRPQFSFSTGLKPTRQRPFQLHLCHKLTVELDADFRRLNYKILRIPIKKTAVSTLHSDSSAVDALTRPTVT